MTETNHVSLLRQGKAAWSAWREANPSIHPDLREANLNANLTGALLRGADLGKANFSRANLTDAILGGSDFSGADLSGATLSRANLGRTILREANLSRATLIGGKLSGANLSLADLSGANLSDADLDGADLSGADLNRTNLRLANLSNAQLTGVQWQLRAMRGCYLGIRGLDSCFGNALFKGAAADQDFIDTLETHLKGTRAPSSRKASRAAAESLQNSGRTAGRAWLETRPFGGSSA